MWPEHDSHVIVTLYFLETSTLDEILMIIILNLNQSVYSRMILMLFFGSILFLWVKIKGLHVDWNIM